MASLTAQALPDHAFDPAALRGQPAMVIFVTPTCPHCAVELPRARDAAKAAGAKLVAVFVSGTRERASAVVASTHFTDPALFDDGTLRDRYAVKSVPYTLVLGRDGHARDAFVGEQDESTLEAAIADAR